METKSLKQSIAIPVGYEAINIQNINGSIVYELVEVKKSLRDELVVKLKQNEIGMYFIEQNGGIWRVDANKRENIQNINYIPTKKLTEAFLALMELTKWNWVMNDFCELEKSEIKAVIWKDCTDDLLKISTSHYVKPKILNFITIEAAEEFHEEFHELLKTAKQLL